MAVSKTLARNSNKRGADHLTKVNRTKIKSKDPLVKIKKTRR